MSKQTEHISPIAKLVATNPADEVRKVQSKIVRKVAKEDKKTGTYVPHKFLEPQAGVPLYNMVLADTRGGDHLDTSEEIQMEWGCKHYLKVGGQEIYGYYIDGQPLAGLFDAEKKGREAQLFRERIHLLGIVSEKTFGEDQVIQQTHLYRNHFLPDSKLASAAFPLAGKTYLDSRGNTIEPHATHS